MSRSRESPPIAVLSTSARSTRAVVTLGVLRVPVAIGRAGRLAIKREGDGASPMGRWRLLSVLYRPDRVWRPATALPVTQIRRLDGWCDAGADANYNRMVRLPYAASAETLWREDHLYDLVVVLDHNQCPRRRNGGSAIFLHLARPGFTPTAGCVAFREADLRHILARLHRGASIRI